MRTNRVDIKTAYTYDEFGPSDRSGHAFGVGDPRFEDPGPIDSHLFWKATLEFAPVLPSLVPGQAWTVPVVRSYYTEGASGWVANDGYVWGANSFRSFTMVRIDNRIEITLNATAIGINADNGRARSATVAWTCPVIHRAVGQLTPWAGKAGTSWESFYPDITPDPVRRPGQ